MYYELRAGWREPLRRFDNEVALVRAWERVYRNQDAGCWLIDNDGRRWGHVGSLERPDVRAGKWVNTCMGCDRLFTAPNTSEPLCPACAVSVRPCEPL